MAVQKETIMLCGFVIILGLLQGSAGYECSSEANGYAYYNLPGHCSSKYHDWSNSSFTPFPRARCPFPFNREQAPIYIIIVFAPLMIYFPILILFNFDLASGPAQTFIFFYQALPTALPFDSSLAVIYKLGIGLFSGFLTMQSPITDLSFPRTLPYLALEYCKLAAVALVVVMTLLLVKCIDCPCASWRRPWAKLRHCVRHFREKRALKGTVLNGLCSITILTYGFVIQQSFMFLQPATETYCPNSVKRCAYYCTQLNYTSPDYYPYHIAALGSLVLALPLPLLLLYYPAVPALMQRITKKSSALTTCHRLAPVFDVFQSAYKPKLRFFAAFPLFYRLVIWLLFSGLSAVLSQSNKQLAITYVFIAILAIHSLVQPYSNPKHNYIETLYLVNLVLISVIFTVSELFFIGCYNDQIDCTLSFVTTLLPPILAYLPAVAGIGYLFWKCNCCKRCSAVCCKRIKQNRRKSVEEETAQVLPHEVYFELSDVQQVNLDED